MFLFLHVTRCSKRFVQTLEVRLLQLTSGFIWARSHLQKRRRLVLVGALAAGAEAADTPAHAPDEYVTVDAIGALPLRLASGEHDPRSSARYARRLSPMNLKRAQHSRRGGTWQDWPMELRCRVKFVMSARELRVVLRPHPGADEPAPSRHRHITLARDALLIPYPGSRPHCAKPRSFRAFPGDFIFTGPDRKKSLLMLVVTIRNTVPPFW